LMFSASRAKGKRLFLIQILDGLLNRLNMR